MCEGPGVPLPWGAAGSSLLPISGMTAGARKAPELLEDRGCRIRSAGGSRLTLKAEGCVYPHVCVHPRPEGASKAMWETQKGVRRGRCHVPDLGFVGDLSASGGNSSCDLPGALSPLAKNSPALQAPLETPGGHRRFAAALLRWEWCCGLGHFQQVLAVAVPSGTGWCWPDTPQVFGRAVLYQRER